MSEKKLSPRQKMIGMMYLVLTALLALNVSASILNAFVLIDESLNKTGQNLKKKSDAVMNEFTKAEKLNPAKVKEWKDKADKSLKMADELYTYVADIKTSIVKIADGSDVAFKKEHAARTVQKKDENNVPGQVMILQGKGLELKGKIEKFRADLIALVKDKTLNKGVVENINATLATGEVVGEEGGLQKWEIGNFDQLPLIAVIAMLSKIQNDIRNAEADILSYLLTAIGAEDLKFNKIEAIVKTPSSYVNEGQKFEAEIFIAASDSTQDPEILVGGAKLPVKNGKGIYNGSTTGVGEKTFGGIIKIQTNSGPKEFDFKSTYQVGRPALVVSPTKMNVFYIGVENPVEISVSGVPESNLRVSISDGSISKAAQGYIVKVKKPGKVNISVSAEIDGATKSMGSKEFRVKTVPDPIAKVAGKKEGFIAKNVLLTAPGPVAEMENFDFELRFTISSFVVSATLKGGYDEEAKATGTRFNAKQLDLIRQVPAGRKVYIEQIKATGPDGSTRSLPPCNFKLQ